MWTSRVWDNFFFFSFVFLFFGFSKQTQLLPDADHTNLRFCVWYNADTQYSFYFITGFYWGEQLANYSHISFWFVIVCDITNKHILHNGTNQHAWLPRPDIRATQTDGKPEEKKISKPREENKNRKNGIKEENEGEKSVQSEFALMNDFALL